MTRTLTSPVRWGILATGGIAHSFAADLIMSPGNELAAVGSRRLESAESFAAEFATTTTPRAHGSYQALADDPDVDVIYVATPHSGHHEATLTCLRAGKSALVEKAFTINAAEAEELVGEARARGLFLCEAMWTRWNPALCRIRELIAAGEIGTVRVVAADFGFAFDGPPSHRLVDPALGGGALLDLGIYPISLASMLLGPPTEAKALSTPYATGADGITTVIGRHAGGAISTSTCSLESVQTASVTICGTAGRIDIAPPLYFPTTFTVSRHGHPAEVVTVPHEGKGYLYEIAEVRRCLEAGLGESPDMPLDETVALMRLMDDVRAEIGLRYPND